MICTKCNNELRDNAKFCAFCGEKITYHSESQNINKPKFCYQCGSEIKPEANYCENCGWDISPKKINQTGISNQQKKLINTITKRYSANGIIWIIIAIIQILLGFSGLWVTLIIGILNIISGILAIQFINKYKKNHKGLVARVKPLVLHIIILVYNLFIGGVIGVIGSIYYLVAIRHYVMKNEKEFLILENTN